MFFFLFLLLVCCFFVFVFFLFYPGFWFSSLFFCSLCFFVKPYILCAAGLISKTWENCRTRNANKPSFWKDTFLIYMQFLLLSGCDPILLGRGLFAQQNFVVCSLAWNWNWQIYILGNRGNTCTVRLAGDQWAPMFWGMKLTACQLASVHQIRRSKPSIAYNIDWNCLCWKRLQAILFSSLHVLSKLRKTLAWKQVATVTAALRHVRAICTQWTGHTRLYPWQAEGTLEEETCEIFHPGSWEISPQAYEKNQRNMPQATAIEISDDSDEVRILSWNLSSLSLWASELSCINKSICRFFV